MIEVSSAPTDDTDLSPEDRRNSILALVNQAGTVPLEHLAQRYGVSRMTIHRDLDYLAGRGYLRKERGAATAEGSRLYESSFDYRFGVFNEEKQRLAQAARKLIGAGDVIMLDDSTTVLPMIDELEDIEMVTVITNSFAICQRVDRRPNIQVISTGGDFSPSLAGFYGHICEQSLLSMRADWAFLSAPSVIDTATYHQDQRVLRLKRVMMESADRKVLLVTADKFAVRGFYHSAALTEFDRVFVAGALDRTKIQHLRESGINLEIV